MVILHAHIRVCAKLDRNYCRLSPRLSVIWKIMSSYEFLKR